MAASLASLQFSCTFSRGHKIGKTSNLQSNQVKERHQPPLSGTQDFLGNPPVSFSPIYSHFLGLHCVNWPHLAARESLVVLSPACVSPSTVTTKRFRLGMLSNRNSLSPSLEARSPRWKCQQVCLLPGAVLSCLAVEDSFLLVSFFFHWV